MKKQIMIVTKLGTIHPRSAYGTDETTHLPWEWCYAGTNLGPNNSGCLLTNRADITEGELVLVIKISERFNWYIEVENESHTGSGGNPDVDGPVSIVVLRY